MREHYQYRNIFSRFQFENEQAQVYSVDYSTSRPALLTDGLVDSTFLGASSLLVTTCGLPEISNGNIGEGIGLCALGGIAGYSVLASGFAAGNKNSHPINTGLASLRTSLIPTAIVGFRDALAAKKISEYLVPKHKQEGRKVQAAILYGAAHAGIEAKIKHPWTADATLWLYHDLFRYGDTAELNQIREIFPGKDEFVEDNCGLF